MTEPDSEENSVRDSENRTRHKIIFIGDNFVGKTAIICNIMSTPYNNEPTIGIDFMTKVIKYRGQNIRLQLWDTTGQEKYKGLIPSYIRKSSFIFLVYDISNKSTFDNIPRWISFIRSIENTTFVLCGNKIDLECREVTKEEGEAFAKKEGIAFFETSAFTGVGIKNMFYSTISDLPEFAENNNKENLIKELMEENGVQNIAEGIKYEGQQQVEHNMNINVNGQVRQVNIKKIKGKKCTC